MLFQRKSTKRTPEAELEIVDRVLQLMDDLWRPVRMLADLEAVWPELDDRQRAEIEASSTYRDRFHEKRAEELVGDLQMLVSELPGGPYRDVRNDLGRYVRQWRQEEPDALKILIGRLKQAREKARPESADQ